MKKLPINLLTAVLFSGSAFLSSCSNDDDSPKDRTFNNGIFVTNEGQYGKSNGDVSFIEKNTKVVEPNVFLTINGRPAGDVVQSMTFHNGKAYIVVNNSSSIEVANAQTFKSEGVITGIQQPRYMVVSGRKAYISNWVQTDFVNRVVGEVVIADLNTNTILKRVAVGSMPEQLAIAGNKLFVTNSNDNTVSVINMGTDAVEATITTGYKPSSVAADAAGKIWVLSTGDYGANKSKLVKINAATNAVEIGMDFLNSGAADLIINPAKNTLYYSFEGRVFKMSTSATTLPTTQLIGRNFYGLGIDPSDSFLYGANAGDFSSPGTVIRYNMSGVALDSFTVGIAPNGFYFQ